MKQKSITLAIMVFSVLGATITQGAVIFSQDFSSSTTVSTYVSATPGSGQMNAIGSSGAGVVVGISSSALTYARSGANVGSFSRTTDFSPTPTAIIYQFDLTLTGNSVAQTSSAVFQVGSSFGTTNAAESNANTYARFAINFGTTAGQFGIRDVTNGTSSALFSGTQSIFWVLNNSNSSLNYTAPNTVTTAIANDTADLWLGNTKVLNGVNVQTAAQSMNDLKFAFENGTGTLSIDNILITSIPEPTTALLGSLGLLAVLRRRR